MRRLLSITIFAAIFISLSVIANAQDENKSPEENKNSDNVIIPEGKIAKLSLQTRLSSKLSEVNDEVIAVLYEPLRAEDGGVVIERGTEFIGRVTQVQAAKRPQKEATMTVIFNTMRMPYGAEKISVTIVAIDDYANDQKLKAKNDEGKVGGGRSGGRTAGNAGAGGGLGTLVGIVAAGAGAGLPGLAVGIGAGAAGGVLVTKGNDIKLEPGTILRIKFERPVALPAFESER
jgi:hypothetical protein